MTTRNAVQMIKLRCPLLEYGSTHNKTDAALSTHGCDGLTNGVRLVSRQAQIQHQLEESV